VAITAPLSARTILRTVWDDLGELWVRLRSQSIIAFASAIIFTFIGPATTDNRILADVIGLIGTAVVVPFEIAIYRLLISGEAASGYRFDISTVRFQRMLGWSIGFCVLSTVPFHLSGALAPSEDAEAITGIVLFAPIIFATVRLTIFLPAIAVDAPGASVRNAFADTSGHVWLIVKAYLTILMPVILILISMAVLAALGGVDDIFSHSGNGSVAANAFFGALGFLVSTSFSIISARLFMKIADRVKNSGPEASE
jgi:hypothetical protein